MEHNVTHEAILSTPKSESKQNPYKKKWKNERAKRRAQIEQIRQEHNEEISKIGNNFQKERDFYKQKLAELELKLSDTRNELKNVSKLKQQHEAEIKTVKEKYRSKYKEKANRLQSEMDMNMLTERAKLEKEYEDDYLELKQEVHEKLNATKPATIKQKITSLKA